jgi:hypothetical protein
VAVQGQSCGTRTVRDYQRPQASGPQAGLEWRDRPSAQKAGVQLLPDDQPNLAPRNDPDVDRVTNAVQKLFDLLGTDAGVKITL